MAVDSDNKMKVQECPDMHSILVVRYLCGAGSEMSRCMRGYCSYLHLQLSKCQSCM